MEAAGAVLDDADPVVEALHSTVGEAEAEDGEDALAVLAESASDLHEGGEVQAARPGEPGAEVLFGGPRSASVEHPQLLLEQVGAEDVGVEARDGAETDGSSSRRFAGALRSAHREPLTTAASGETLRSRASVCLTSRTATLASVTTWNGSKTISAWEVRTFISRMNGARMSMLTASSCLTRSPSSSKKAATVVWERPSPIQIGSPVS